MQKKIFISLIVFVILSLSAIAVDNTLEDLSATDPGNWILRNATYDMVIENASESIYIVGNENQFGRYNFTSNIMTDLRYTDVGDWIGAYVIYSVEYSDNESIYVGLASSKFGRYNSSSNTLVDLSATDTGNWLGTTNEISAIASQNGTESVYIGAAQGKFGRYNRTSNTARDLSGTDTGNWMGMSEVREIKYVNNESVYIGLSEGKFGRYNSSSNIMTDLSYTDTTNWLGTSPLISISFINASESIYISAYSGKFGKYNYSANVMTDLSGTDTGNWMGSTQVNAVAVQNATNFVYIGADAGKFGRYNISSNVMTDLSTTDPGNWLGTNDITQVCVSNQLNTVFISTRIGQFGKYIFTNHAPTKPSTPTFTSPATAYTNSNLTLSTGTGSTDSDGNSITYYYLFNDTSDSATLQTWSTNNVFDCDTAGCNKGDTIKGYVRAYDSALYSDTSNAATIIINNRLPVTASLIISPASPSYKDSLSITNITTEIDGDTITAYSIRWYVNGTQKTTLNNLTLISTGINKGEVYIASLRANDGTAWSTFFNSSSVTISDTYAPTYASITPSTITQNEQSILSLTFLDASSITDVTFTLLDPDSTVVFNDYSMTLNNVKQNANETYNTTYSKSYTPLLAGYYIVVNKTATDSNGYKLTDTTPISIYSNQQHTSGGGGDTGGGGGGGSEPEPASSANFTLSPNKDAITVSAGGKKTIEFAITNQETKDIQVRISINPNGDESKNWVTLQNGYKEYVINVTKSQGLQSNRRLVRYTIAVPSDTLEKDYKFVISATSASGTQTYTATVTVGDSFLTWLNKPWWSYEYQGCADNAFSTTSSECVSPVTKTFGFGFLHVFGLFIIFIGILIYQKTRKKGKRR